MLAQVTYNDTDLNALVIDEYVDEGFVYYTVELYDMYDPEVRMNDIEAMIEANDDSYLIDAQINEWIKNDREHSY